MKPTKPPLKRAGIFVIYFAVAIAVTFISALIIAVFAATIVSVLLALVLILAFAQTAKLIPIGYEHEAFFGVLTGVLFSLMLALIL
jgi:hypothetical protein